MTPKTSSGPNVALKACAQKLAAFRTARRVLDHFGYLDSRQSV